MFITVLLILENILKFSYVQAPDFAAEQAAVVRASQSQTYFRI